VDVSRLWEEILELFFPPRCGVCDLLGEEAFCPACRAAVELLTPPYCVSCGRALMPSAGAEVLCGECRLTPPETAGARSVGLHSGVLRQAVLRMKFDRRRELIRPLGQLLAERVRLEASYPHPVPLDHVTAILPVPLHPRRRAWRGFDQAVLLSRVLSRAAGLSLWENVLVRVKNTPQQIGLSSEQRRQNVRHAFAVRRPHQDRIRGGDFLLVDDVYTTGATLQEAARTLNRAGAQRVYALTLTRTAPTWHLGSLVQLGDEEDGPPGI
jgi:ComF family protein